MTNESDLAKLYVEIVPQTMHGIRRHMREAKGKLTIAQMRIMANLYRGLSSTSELAERHGVSMPAMSKMVDGLVCRELIERETSSKDRRQIHLTLSKLGMKTYLEIRKITLGQISKELASLNPNEKEELKRGLQIMEKVNRKTE